MLRDSPVFSGFSVNDIDSALRFYRDVLGLAVSEEDMGLTITGGNGYKIFVYAKDDHQPSTFTILNFPVDDIKATVVELNAKGVTFERYPDMTDNDGIAWGTRYNQGPDIAWFKDPAGNFLSVISSDPNQS